MKPFGWALIKSDSCSCKKRRLGHKRHTKDKCTEKRFYEDTARRQPWASQAERPWEKPNLPTPWPWTSSLQRKKISGVWTTQSVVFRYGKSSKLIYIVQHYPPLTRLRWWLPPLTTMEVSDEPKYGTIPWEISPPCGRVITQNPLHHGDGVTCPLRDRHTFQV